MSFEQFMPEQTKKLPKRSNTIGYYPKLKKLSIYRVIFEKYFNGFEYVHLFYDRENKLIGIQPIEKEDQSSLKLTGQKAKTLMIGKFIKQYQIEIKENQNFSFKEQDGMLVIKI